MRLSKHITVRITEELWKDINDHAAKNGVLFSAELRDRLEKNTDEAKGDAVSLHFK